MSIIPRQELQLECRQAGNDVVIEVLTQGAAITDERMDELFEPLITSVEERARSAVESELDELRGQHEDREAANLRDDIINRRRANIMERALIDTGCDRPVSITRVGMHRRAKTGGDNLDDVSDSELLEYSSDDEHWNDYLDTYHIDFHGDKHLEAIFYMINGYNAEQLPAYFEENNMDIETSLDYLEKIKSMDIYSYCVQTIERTLRYMKPVAVSTPCQMAIRAGLRKGMICGRKPYKQGKCRYHHRKTVS